MWYPLPCSVSETHLIAILPDFSECQPSHCFWPGVSVVIPQTDVRIRLRRGNVKEILIGQKAEAGGEKTAASQHRLQILCSPLRHEEKLYQFHFYFNLFILLAGASMEWCG